MLVWIFLRMGNASDVVDVGRLGDWHDAHHVAFLEHGNRGSCCWHSLAFKTGARTAVGFCA